MDTETGGRLKRPTRGQMERATIVQRSGFTLKSGDHRFGQGDDGSKG